MGFRQADSEGRGGFARVWSVDDKGNYSLVKLSTSRKRRDGEGYETDFQDGFVRFIGSAHEKAKELNPGEKGVSIQITSCEAATNYNEKDKKTYHNYLVYAFNTVDGNESKSEANSKKASTKASSKAKKKVEDDNDDEDLPF